MINNNNKIVFIGPISPPVTGPGVKNKEIIDALDRKTIDIVQVNSLNWSKNFFKFFRKVVKNSIKHKRVLLSVSEKGRYVLMPIMYFLKLLFGVKYILLPAGGNLDKEINSMSLLYKPLFLSSLRNATKIYVESRSLAKGLKYCGLGNIEYMPNPRRNQQYLWKFKNNSEKKVVFLSKIKAEKGVVILVDAVKKLLANDIPIILEFYGPIDKNFEEEFYHIISDSDSIKYNGISNPEDVQKIISEADIFVLPTMWKNEGLPGVLVEASFTGVPLIISRFRASEEFIEHSKNGLIVEPGQIDELSKNIKLLIESDELSKKLSKEFFKLSSAFDVDLHVQTILDEMKKSNWRI